MSQKLTINLSKEEAIKLIKDNLVQEDKNETPVQYDVEIDIEEGLYNYMEDKITITIFKNISIGEFPGKINEEIDINTLKRMLKNTLEIEGYILENWDFIILRKDIALSSRKDLTFNGIEVSMVPSDEKTTFIRNLIQ